MAPTEWTSKLRQGVERAGTYVRSYTGGASSSDLRRLFERDAPEAYAVLTRDVAGRSEGADALSWESIRAFFVGLSSKLSPARRMLFSVSVLLAVVGMLSIRFRGTLDSGVGFNVDFSPLWFVLSIAGLGLLLTLELVDRLQVRDELEVARELQQALLPNQDPTLPGWRLAHSYRTANTVGGDYYGFPVLPDGRVAVMIGDASGHGMAAGLLMAITDATAATALDLDPDPTAVAAILNRSLLRIGGRRAFLSFFYALLDPVTGELDYVCAGHPYPLLRRADGGVEELGEGGFPLGLRPELEPCRGHARLGFGDLLALYTDGIVEAVDERDEAFGFPRLRQLVQAGGRAATVHDRVRADLDRHRGDRGLTDDVTLVVLERVDPAVPMPPPVPPTPGATARPLPPVPRMSPPPVGPTR
jgi:phosphoserine phosphatase RsbU/P